MAGQKGETINIKKLKGKEDYRDWSKRMLLVLDDEGLKQCGKYKTNLYAYIKPIFLVKLAVSPASYCVSPPSARYLKKIVVGGGGMIFEMHDSFKDLYTK